MKQLETKLYMKLHLIIEIEAELNSNEDQRPCVFFTCLFGTDLKLFQKLFRNFRKTSLTQKETDKYKSKLGSLVQSLIDNNGQLELIYSYPVIN